ncbi:MAG: hypothetical protein CVT95_03870 [Bacteroidetes bacterium HGW-Bacteroidetes-12]|nr:MAG: hypothetical protein CVT95_03870 [Bacteroidetes bacterium HGW-Bacteroidetes-12]
MRYFIFSLFIFLSITSFGQKNIFVRGIVIDNETKLPIALAHIKIHNQNIITKTNEQGAFKMYFYAQKRTTLVISHTSYQTTYEVVNTEKDTLNLTINLEKKTIELTTFTVEDNSKPITVFKSAKINVSDYEFHKNNFVFIAYEKNPLKDSKIYLVDEQQTILNTHFIPCEPVELYTDYLGNINLICKNAIYRIDISNQNQITLYKLPLEDFYQLVKPVLDTLDKTIIFSDFLQQFHRFKYYAFNTEDTTLSIIKEVVHKDMDWQYQYEYYNLNNAEKQFAKRMAKKYKGYDKHDIAAVMTGFANNFMYEEVYAPLFIINDTIHIFDHYENKIIKFIYDTVETSSVKIDYHIKQNGSKWKKQLFMDELNGEIYALFLKQGYYILKKINTNTGKITSETKLQHQFVSKIKVKDGYVYYTYKPQQSLQKKFLFKEKL